MAEQGHNSGIKVAAVADLAERISKLMDDRDGVREEAKTYTADIAEIFAEAKGTGYDTKALREAVRLKRMSPALREAIGLYTDALGIFG